MVGNFLNIQDFPERTDTHTHTHTLTHTHTHTHTHTLWGTTTGWLAWAAHPPQRQLAEPHGTLRGLEK